MNPFTCHRYVWRVPAASRADVEGDVDIRVVVPVRNEAHRVEACLRALACQLRRDGSPFPVASYRVVLLLNNCTDDTWHVVDALTPTLALSIEMMDGVLATDANHAGGARHAALSWAAADWTSRRERYLFCTDADSVVGPTWLADGMAAFGSGCDAVAGSVHPLPDEWATLPPRLRAREDAERRYTRLLDEIDARLDPLPHNPWPTHRTCSGANMAIRASAWHALAMDSFPRCGEDRALMSALRRCDRSVRHAPGWSVGTSVRLTGRAAGGMADTLAYRRTHPAAPCDRTLEPAALAAHRARARCAARSGHRRSAERDASPWHDATGIDHLTAARTGSGYFGETWERIEATRPDLAHQALHPDNLMAEMRVAEALLDELRGVELDTAIEAAA